MVGKLPAALQVQSLDQGEADSLWKLRTHCRCLDAFALDGLSNQAVQCLTSRERNLWQGFGEKRRQSFLASRVALKRLACRLDPDRSVDGANLESVADDGLRPLCPVGPGSDCRYASAAHDDRFVVAVADDHPVGVDVEPLDERILRLANRFTIQEQQLLAQSSKESLSLAARIWTAKESAAKALNLGLNRVLKQVAITHITPESSLVCFENRSFPAWFAQVSGHVFCLLRLV